jgi:hypothetical protein
MQHVLKSLPGAAWTEVIPAKLLDELLVAVNAPKTASNFCLRRKASSSLTASFEESSLLLFFVGLA